ncbi:hypothetical protein TWF718_007430 [Orbilia javanica]|uniref:Cyclic nucleotide-binding domain-containing protein n=1 Tax=Orbilia javanica TaxID=47235 RepID=A0AAN8MZ85_9PEZI
MPEHLQQLIIARAEGGTRPKTRRIAKDVMLMHLPPGYELNNKLKLNNSLLPGFGELSVLYIDDPKHATELIELIRLRAESPLVNSIPPKRREKPLPPHNEHPGNIKYISDFLDEEEEAQASQYRHVMSRIHEVIITGLLKYISSDPSHDKTGVLAYLQNLGRASPVWEERAKRLLLEEHQVLQDMMKEIQGGWPFLQHFLSSNMITAAQWERLIVTAMAETVSKSPVLRDYHMVVYDVSIDHFVHGKVGETLLSSLEAWKCPIDSVGPDSFRINSPFMTSRKHPMQRLDELGEKFFRKLTNTHQSGETLYTRAVLCRSLLTTYFFQSFVSVWDDCILNGHLQGLKGLVPVVPKIIDRLRDYMAHGSCPRESHPEVRNTTKKSVQKEDKDVSSIMTSKGHRILVVQASLTEDVEMVDASPLSDDSSETIIQQEGQRHTISINQQEDKRRKRRERRKQIRRATLITIDQKPTENVSTVEKQEVVASGSPQVANEKHSAGTVTRKNAADVTTQSIIDDLSVGKVDDGSKLSEQVVDAPKIGMEFSCLIDEASKVEELALPEASVGGQNYIKNRAKKERRRARAANLAVLQQVEQPVPVAKQDVAASTLSGKETVSVPEKQLKRKKRRNLKAEKPETTDREKEEPVHKTKEPKPNNRNLPSHIVEESAKSTPQKQDRKMPRRRKTAAQVAPCTVPGADFAEPAVRSDKPVASKSQAPTPPKPNPDLYDDPEAIAAGIKASEEEESSWTKVGGKKHDASKTSKFMEMRGLRSAGHGRNAVFTNRNIPSRPPPPHHNPNPKAPPAQGKSVLVQNQPKAGVAQSQGKVTPPRSQTTITDPQSQMKAIPPQSQMKPATPQNQTKTMTPLSQMKATTFQSQVKAITPQSQTKSTPPQSQTKTTPPQGQMKTITPQGQMKPIPRSQAKAATPKSQSEATTPQSQVKATIPQSQMKATPPQNQKKATPPQNQKKATPPQVQTKATPPQVQPKATPSQAQTKAVQNKNLPKADTLKSPASEKKQLPKENQKPTGKPPRRDQKRDACIPSFNSMKEFPTLATSNMLLSRQKETQLAGELSMDMTVELASREVESPAHTNTVTRSATGETKASDEVSVKKRGEIITAASPSRSINSIKTKRNKRPAVAHVVESKEHAAIVSTTTTGPSANVGPLAVKSQVHDIEAKTSIMESKKTLDMPKSSSPLAETSYESIAPVTPTKVLTKRERRALAKKAAEEQKAPKLSIKERAELRRSLESKKSPKPVDKAKEQPTAPVVAKEEEPLATESPGIAHPGTPTESPGITHPGTSVPRPNEVELASGVSNGMRYRVVATEEAARVLRGTPSGVPQRGEQPRVAPAVASRPGGFGPAGWHPAGPGFAVPRVPPSAVGMRPRATFGMGVPWAPFHYQLPVGPRPRPGPFFYPGGPTPWPMGPRGFVPFGYPVFGPHFGP